MNFINISIVSCALCILLGAFGAHALSDTLSPERMNTWQTAVNYQMFQSLALFSLSICSLNVKRKAFSQWGFALGTFLFSGSLYAICLGAPTTLGIITPIGAMLWLLSWLNLVQKY